MPTPKVKKFSPPQSSEIYEIEHDAITLGKKIEIEIFSIRNRNSKQWLNINSSFGKFIGKRFIIALGQKHGLISVPSP